MSGVTKDLQPSGRQVTGVTLPSRQQAALFIAKAWCFRSRRWFRDRVAPRLRPLSSLSVDASLQVLAVSRSPLYAEGSVQEFRLQAGKVQNLRTAARYLNGLVIPAGRTFSFWTQVPRPSRRLGFAEGRELREGCLVPSIGGGLCQLSNALYDVALTAGCEILERHAHSHRLPGSMAVIGRDATVFWNYVDLRFRPLSDCQLEVRLTKEALIIALRG